MTETHETTATETTTNPERPSVVDALFDAALAWVDVGLAHAKTSLDGTARAMDRTAKLLDTVRERIKPSA